MKTKRKKSFIPILVNLLFVPLPKIAIAHPIGEILKPDRGESVILQYQNIQNFGQYQAGDLSGQTHINQWQMIAKPELTDSTKGFALLSHDQTRLPKNSIKTGKNNSIEIEQNLTNIQYHFGFKRQAENMWSALIGFGSPSDDPFGRARDTELTATLIYGVGQNIQQGIWHYYLNYSNNRTFLNNIPLPGFSYSIKISPHFFANLGVPFNTLTWMDFPTYRITLMASPWGAHYYIGYGILGPIQIFHSFRFELNSYMHKNRLDNDDRLFVESKNFRFGFEGPVAKNFWAQLAVGYRFDNSLYESESVFGDHVGKINFNNQYFLDLLLRASF